MHGTVLLLMAPAVLAARQFLPYSECVSKGYLAGQLACNTCAELEVIVGRNDAVATDCRSCCSPAIDMALPTRYDAAKLNVCTMRQNNWGGVNEWIEKSAMKWAAEVEVTDDCTGEPRLIFGADGFKPQPKLSSGPWVGRGTVEVPVGTWKIEHIDALLKSKLKGQE